MFWAMTIPGRLRGITIAAGIGFAVEAGADPALECPGTEKATDTDRACRDASELFPPWLDLALSTEAAREHPTWEMVLGCSVMNMTEITSVHWWFELPGDH
jgi:hypothetical protein